MPLLYVADSGNVPYGDKTPDYVRERSLTLTQFLVRHGAAAIVIACNTATAAAAAMLRQRFDIPIIAMEPAVKPAVTATRSRRQQSPQPLQRKARWRAPCNR